MMTVERFARGGVERVTVTISSPGGEVATGLKLYGELRSAPLAELVTYNNGSVASAANLVYLAGDKRIATPDAKFYLHPVFLPGKDGLEVTTEHLSDLRRLGERTLAPSGELTQLDTACVRLERYERQAQAIFVARTGLTPERIGALVNNRSILDAAEARSVGIVHEIVSPD